MTSKQQRKRDNLGLAGRLLLMVAGSFAFGYALVPISPGT